MIDNEAIEGYLIRMDRTFEQIGEGMWRVHDQQEGVPDLILKHSDPILVVRMKVMELPESGREGLYRRLLELNAHGIAFGAYAVDDGAIFLVDSLRADGLDRAGLQASIESLVMAVNEHYRELQPFMTTGE